MQKPNKTNLTRMQRLRARRARGIKHMASVALTQSDVDYFIQIGVLGAKDKYDSTNLSSATRRTLTKLLLLHASLKHIQSVHGVYTKNGKMIDLEAIMNPRKPQ